MLCVYWARKVEGVVRCEWLAHSAQASGCAMRPSRWAFVSTLTSAFQPHEYATAQLQGYACLQ